MTDSLFSGMLASIVDTAASSANAPGSGMMIEELTVDCPMEVSLDAFGPGLRFDASGPSQTIETTVLPVFHRVRATIAFSGDGDG